MNRVYETGRRNRKVKEGLMQHRPHIHFPDAHTMRKKATSNSDPGKMQSAFKELHHLGCGVVGKPVNMAR